MEQRVNKLNAARGGKPFVIYGLVCPVTLEIKYVGQATDMNKRTQQLKHHSHDNAVSEWIKSLGGYLFPYRVILERGVNRVVRVRVMAHRKAGAPGPSPCGYKDVWLSSCLETKWIKRFRRTALNRRAQQLPTLYDALTNPPLPWDETEAK
jgi:hypothetical protein